MTHLSPATTFPLKDVVVVVVVVTKSFVIE
jgi:hypothetical protein